MSIYSKIAKEVKLNKDSLKPNFEYLRICSYNVHYQAVQDTEDLMRYAHILVLQEVGRKNLNYYKQLCNKYNMQHYSIANGMNNQNMLLMVCYDKKYVKNVYDIQMKYTDVPLRGAIFLNTITPNGHAYKICCTHLTQIRGAFGDAKLQTLGRNKRIIELQKYFMENPNLIIGDLNIQLHHTNKSQCHQLLNSGGYRHTTSYDNKKDTTNHKGVRVDHAFYKGIRNILKSVVLSDYVSSDHRPIVQLVE